MATALRRLQEAAEAPPPANGNADDSVVYLIGIAGVFVLSVAYCCCKNACMNYRRARRRSEARAEWAKEAHRAARPVAGFRRQLAEHCSVLPSIGIDALLLVFYSYPGRVKAGVSSLPASCF